LVEVVEVVEVVEKVEKGGMEERVPERGRGSFRRGWVGSIAPDRDPVAANRRHHQP